MLEVVWFNGHGCILRSDHDDNSHGLYWKGILVLGPALFDACARYYQAEFL